MRWKQKGLRQSATGSQTPPFALIQLCIDVFLIGLNNSCRASPAIEPSEIGWKGGRKVVVPTSGIGTLRLLDKTANPFIFDNFP